MRIIPAIDIIDGMCPIRKGRLLGTKNLQRKPVRSSKEDMEFTFAFS
jgi:phosphoribosylformimino-5-aminoimidazole carboxamide ribonucleotide (ProFAR) isomerase